MARLPDAVDGSSCESASDAGAAGSVVVVACNPASSSSGTPSRVFAETFSSTTALRRYTTGRIQDLGLAQRSCEQPPAHTVWHVEERPGVFRGQMLCYTSSDDSAWLRWTYEDEAILMTALGSDVDDLFTWWKSAGVDLQG